MTVPQPDLSTANARGGWEWVSLRIDVNEWLHGSGGSALSVRYAPKPRDMQPSLDTIYELDGQIVAVFLVQVDDPDRAGWYFAPVQRPYGCQAVLKADDESTECIRREIGEQHRLLASNDWTKVSVSKDTTTRVEKLIDQLLQARSEAAAMNQLLMLDRRYVPALIMHLSDHRKLPRREMKHPNSPGAFEAFALYTPEEVVDVLVTALNRITGESFGFLANGGSVKERERTTAAWRVYLERLQGGSEPEPCHQGQTQ